MKHLVWIQLLFIYSFNLTYSTASRNSGRTSRCKYMELEYSFINNKGKYAFYPTSYSALSFSVKTTNDAHIALTSAPHETPHGMYEILIGAWENKMSAIRKNKILHNVAILRHPTRFFDGFTRVYLWLRWFQGIIALGKKGEYEPFLTWTDPEEMVPVTHFGIVSNWSAKGNWTIHNYRFNDKKKSCSWISSLGGDVPPEAFHQVGMEKNEDVYICRAQHHGAVIPGKVVPSLGFCYVPWGGKEFPIREYEVLCGTNMSWKVTKLDEEDIPTHAIVSGETETGEPLYVGRVKNENGTMIGKVQASHSMCYIPFNGIEKPYVSCEILTQ